MKSISRDHRIYVLHPENEPGRHHRLRRRYHGGNLGRL